MHASGLYSIEPYELPTFNCSYSQTGRFLISGEVQSCNHIICEFHLQTTKWPENMCYRKEDCSDIGEKEGKMSGDSNSPAVGCVPLGWPLPHSVPQFLNLYSGAGLSRIRRSKWENGLESSAQRRSVTLARGRGSVTKSVLIHTQHWKDRLSL